MTISISFSSNSRDASTTYIIKSALSAYFLAFSTPIFSTSSSVSRIPAVSIIFKPKPFNFMDSSSTSRVVPATLVTIALSSPTKRFKREDFPTFGFPTITVLIPSFKSFPLSALSINFFISSFTDNTVCSSFSRYPSRLICSGSSIADSIKAISYKISSRSAFTLSKTKPFS